MPLSFPIFLFVLLFCLTKRIEFKKISEGKITITEHGYICCSKSYNFISEYIFMEVLECGKETGCNQTKELQMIILFNTNPNEIDLDYSTIKNIPFKFLYHFKDYLGNNKEIESNLTRFGKGKFENKIKNELEKYDPDYKKASEFSTFNDVSKQILKLTETFYSFFAYEFNSMKSSSKENFQRIDWIFSQNFDRLFIGVVKNDTSYKNKFTYSLSEIDKFIILLRNGKYIFQIYLKGGNTVDICTFNYQEINTLNSFIYLINGQIKDKANCKNIPSSNITTPQKEI